MSKPFSSVQNIRPESDLKAAFAEVSNLLSQASIAVGSAHPKLKDRLMEIAINLGKHIKEVEACLGALNNESSGRGAEENQNTNHLTALNKRHNESIIIDMMDEAVKTAKQALREEISNLQPRLDRDSTAAELHVFLINQSQRRSDKPLAQEDVYEEAVIEMIEYKNRDLGNPEHVAYADEMIHDIEILRENAPPLEVAAKLAEAKTIVVLWLSGVSPVGR